MRDDKEAQLDHGEPQAPESGGAEPRTPLAPPAAAGEVPLKSSPPSPTPFELAAFEAWARSLSFEAWREFWGIDALKSLAERFELLMAEISRTEVQVALLDWARKRGFSVCPTECAALELPASPPYVIPMHEGPYVIPAEVRRRAAPGSGAQIDYLWVAFVAARYLRMGDHGFLGTHLLGATMSEMAAELRAFIHHDWVAQDADGKVQTFAQSVPGSPAKFIHEDGQALNITRETVHACIEAARVACGGVYVDMVVEPRWAAWETYLLSHLPEPPKDNKSGLPRFSRQDRRNLRTRATKQ